MYSRQAERAVSRNRLENDRTHVARGTEAGRRHREALTPNRRARRNQTGDMDDTTSGDYVDSKRVKVVGLAAESQHMLPKKHDQTLVVEVSVEHEKPNLGTYS